MSIKSIIKYDDEFLKTVLLQTKSIAIVGLSSDENRPSNFAAKYLQTKGYEIIPINPNTKKKKFLSKKFIAVFLI